MNQSRDRPPPWPDVWWQRMHLDFRAWNGDVQAAREDYDAARSAEEAAPMCRNGLHKLVLTNISRGTINGCRPCKNAVQAAYHARKRKEAA